MTDIPVGARDLRGLSRAAIAWVGADLAVNALTIPASLLELSSPESSLPNAPLDAVGVVMSTLGVAQLIVALGAGFVVLKWIYRVFRNARVLHPGIAGTPAWAVGWYFFPFANLWKPFELFRDAWQVSVEPAAPRRVGTPPILRIWWALWLVNGFIGNLTLRQALHVGSVADVTQSDVASVVGAVLGIGLDGVFITIIRRLTAFQTSSLRSNTFD